MKIKFVVLLLLLGLAGPGYSIDLPLKNVDGSEQNLSDFKGSWVVVNFWATWCPPCIAEMPDLQDFHYKHADKGAMVIGINTENIASERLQGFLDTYAISYPIYQGAKLMDSSLGHVPGLPTTFLVSPQGTVEAKQVGSITSDKIEDFIQKWDAQHAAQ